MARLVKQVSIESPTHKLKECIFNFETPMPEIPPAGARVKVCVCGTVISEVYFILIFLCIHYVPSYCLSVTMYFYRRIYVFIKGKISHKLFASVDIRRSTFFVFPKYGKREHRPYKSGIP